MMAMMIQRHRATTIAAVIAGVAFLGFTKISPDTEKPDPVSEIVATSGTPSVAVLPFVNMSDDKENEYFSDGISEELLNILVKIPDLKVISRTSSFSYKNKNKVILEN